MKTTTPNDQGPILFDIKQQINQITSTLQATFEASQQELCGLHAAEVAALREQLAACEQSCADQEHSKNKLETLITSRNNKLARAFYVWRSFGRQVFLSWRQLTSLQKERISAAEKLAIQLDIRQLSLSFAHWSKVTNAIVLSQKKQIEEEKVKLMLKDVISKYEQERQHLREQLHIAEREVQHGKVERKRLEEATKTLLLRGMSAMNLDTLQLFSGDNLDDSMLDMNMATRP